MSIIKIAEELNWSCQKHEKARLVNKPGFRP
jgi:hypothetical protein